MKKSVLLASLTIFGGIIGAGIFGVPFVFSRAGVLPGLGYVLFLGAAAALINIYYVIVAARTAGRHRLAGYARKHIGVHASLIVAVISFVELFGALLVYIILGGNFLAAIFGSSADLWSMVFLLAAGLIMLLPLKKGEGIDRFFTLTLIIVVAAIIAIIWPQVKAANLLTIDGHNWFMPYGVLFFALGGTSVVPELVEVLRKDERMATKAVTIGTLAAALMIGIFAALIVGVCGAGTTENAIAGLTGYFGRPIVVLGSLFGLAAVLTQFVIIGSNIRDEFIYDFKARRILAWGLALVIPLIIFAAGARDFVGIIGFLGATLGAAVGLVIVYMGRKVMADDPKLVTLRRFAVPLMILFMIGLLAEVASLFL